MIRKYQILGPYDFFHFLEHRLPSISLWSDSTHTKKQSEHNNETSGSRFKMIKRITLDERHWFLFK